MVNSHGFQVLDKQTLQSCQRNFEQVLKQYLFYLSHLSFHDYDEP